MKPRIATLTETDGSADIDRRTLVDVATTTLRNELRNGVLSEGSRIRLGDVSARLGMSAIPVREALRTLASEGLVLALPHRGYRVPAASLDELEDLYQLRLILDPLATEQAVPNMSDGHFSRAEKALERFYDALREGDWHAIRTGNKDFHFAVYDGAGSPWLLRLISMLWDSCERYQLDAGPERGTPKQRRDEHAEILDACRARSPALAAQLMRAHLERTLVLAREALRASRTNA